MGAQAMVMLDEMIKGEKVTKKKTIKSELVVRKSTINIKKS
jgi:DNA-binding LacI/PurR family transcriptional regulator